METWGLQNIEAKSKHDRNLVVHICTLEDNGQRLYPGGGYVFLCHLHSGFQAMPPVWHFTRPRQELVFLRFTCVMMMTLIVTTRSTNVDNSVIGGKRSKRFMSILLVSTSVCEWLPSAKCHINRRKRWPPSIISGSLIQQCAERHREAPLKLWQSGKTKPFELLRPTWIIILIGFLAKLRGKPVQCALSCLFCVSMIGLHCYDNYYISWFPISKHIIYI